MMFHLNFREDECSLGYRYLVWLRHVYIHMPRFTRHYQDIPFKRDRLYAFSFRIYRSIRVLIISLISNGSNIKRASFYASPRRWLLSAFERIINSLIASSSSSSSSSSFPMSQSHCWPWRIMHFLFTYLRRCIEVHIAVAKEVYF